MRGPSERPPFRSESSHNVQEVDALGWLREPILAPSLDEEGFSNILHLCPGRLLKRGSMHNLERLDLKEEW